MDKKIIYSSIQPSGKITLGNYIGAVNNWLKIQEDEKNTCIFGIADLHAITVRQENYSEKLFSLMAFYLSVGLDKDKSIIYYQSHVPAHSQLQWLLNCYTYVGEMMRMTQFKDKSAKHSDNINMGLMDYPVLMAADILLYQADYVPIGIDQMQHLEITRDIAQRFNGIYGDVFTIPQGVLPKVGAKIGSLQDPTAKMSKSDPNPNAIITVLDTPDEIMFKFKRAVTDSGCEICYDPENKAGISNLLSIYSTVTNKSMEDAVADCQGLRYGEFKIKVAEAVISLLDPVRQKYNDLMNNKDYLLAVAKEGANKANEMANQTLDKVMKVLGFI